MACCLYVCSGRRTVLMNSMNLCINAGNFDIRKTHLRADKLDRIASEINRLLDQVQTFMSEAKAAFQYTIQGDINRKILCDGLLPSFADIGSSINSSIDSIIQNRVLQAKEHINSELGDVNDNKTQLVYLQSSFRQSAGKLGEVTIELGEAAQHSREYANRIQEVLQAFEELNILIDSNQQASSTLAQRSNDINSIVDLINDKPNSPIPDRDLMYKQIIDFKKSLEKDVVQANMDVDLPLWQKKSASLLKKHKKQRVKFVRISLFCKKIAMESQLTRKICLVRWVT